MRFISAVRLFRIREMLKSALPENTSVFTLIVAMLQNYSQLPESMPEQAESLEQLRLMSAGINIRTFEVAATGPGVDTPACRKSARPDGAQELAETHDWHLLTASGVFRIWRNFWRNRAETFYCVLFRKTSMLSPCGGIAPARRKPVAIAKAAENPSFVWKMDLCVRWILASMASRRFLWWWMIVAFTTMPAKPSALEKLVQR